MRSVRLLRNDNVIRVVRPFWDSSRSQKFGRSSVVTKRLEDTEPDPYEGNFSFTECDQYTKVTVIGATGRVGRTLSLLLKTCPLVDHLCLFDMDKTVKGVGLDISHIDTKCCVTYVCGMRNIRQALDAPDVVVIAAGCPSSPCLTGKKLFEKNAPIVAGLSEACARFCPKACVVLITSPINSLLPVMGEVYRIITNRIPSRKLFGLTTLDVVRANTFVAEVVRKDPSSVIVPVIGGTSQETIVPVITQMKPCCKIKRGEMMALTECIRRAEGNLADCQNCGTPSASSLSTAYAAFRFTTSLVMALKGAQNIIECAYVKSDIISELEYLASPLKLGFRGVEHNFGYPHLSDSELLGLKRAAVELKSDIQMGKEFVKGIEETVQKGLIWKRLSEEVGKEGKTPRKEMKDTRRRHSTSKDDSKSNQKTELEEHTSSVKKRKQQRKKVEEVVEEEEEVVVVLQQQQQSPLAVQVQDLPMYLRNIRSSTRKSFKRLLFGCQDLESRPIGDDISSETLSADLGVCRNDQEIDLTNQPELNPSPENEPLEEIQKEQGVDDHKSWKCSPFQFVHLWRTCSEGFGLLSSREPTAQAHRGYHTYNESSIRFEEASLKRKDIVNKYRKYIIEDRLKTAIPKKRFDVSKFGREIVKCKTKLVDEEFSKKVPHDLTFERTHYKFLNASAKQKFRSFNMQRKFSPSPSHLIFLIQAKKEREEQNCKALTRHVSKDKDVKPQVSPESTEEESPEDSATEKNNSILLEAPEEVKKIEDPKTELEKLREENEILKRKLVELVEAQSTETALQIKNDYLQLEKTKLKACWLIMSSTMDAFSSFCKKFISKVNSEPETKLLCEPKREEIESEDFHDALEYQPKEREKSRKVVSYDNEYYNFLSKMMEDEVNSEKMESRFGK